MFAYDRVYKYQNKADSKREYMIKHDDTEKTHTTIYIIISMWEGQFESLAVFEDEHLAQNCMYNLVDCKEV